MRFSFRRVRIDFRILGMAIAAVALMGAIGGFVTLLQGWGFVR
jgi:hypothetical protein